MNLLIFLVSQVVRVWSLSPDEFRRYYFENNPPIRPQNQFPIWSSSENQYPIWFDPFGPTSLSSIIDRYTETKRRPDRPLQPVKNRPTHNHGYSSKFNQPTIYKFNPHSQPESISLVKLRERYNQAEARRGQETPYKNWLPRRWGRPKGFYRKGRAKKHANEVVIVPSNGSIIFEQRLTATLGVNQGDQWTDEDINNHHKQTYLDTTYHLDTNELTRHKRSILNTCGATSSLNKTIWNYSFNNNVNGAIRCTLKINKMSQSICFLRIDFLTFLLKPPIDGSCREDRLFITGQNLNFVIPQLCGNITNDHVYVNVDQVMGPVTLNIVTVGGSFNRTWKIQIVQIECGEENMPPDNCVQFHSGADGYVRSFNYNNNVKQYLNNLNYAICLRKEAGYCSIQYQIETNATFNIVNIRNGTDTVPNNVAGVGAVDCPDDHIVIGGSKLCGDKFNDGSNPIMSENAAIIDDTNGPFIIQVKSNMADIGEGFNIRYQQLPC